MYTRLFFPLLLLFALSYQLNAQQFGGPDTKWTYSNNGGDSSYIGATTIAYEKDTLVDGQLIQKFSRKWTHFIVGRTDTLIRDFGPVYFLVENDKVHISLDLVEFDLLYHFTDEVGTRWSIDLEKYNLRGRGTMTFRVLDTYQTEINGTDLLTQKVAVFGFTGAIIDTFYEVLGSRYHYLLPWDKFYINKEATEIMCFQHPELGFVDFGAPDWSRGYLDKYCAMPLTSATSVSSEEQIEVFPNPTQGVLYLDVPNRWDGKPLEIWNCYGQRIYQTRLKRYQQAIDVAAFPTGMYWLVVDGVSMRKVFIQ